jgi:hypothetical protein
MSDTHQWKRASVGNIKMRQNVNSLMGEAFTNSNQFDKEDISFNNYVDPMS